MLNVQLHGSHHAVFDSCIPSSSRLFPERRNACGCRLQVLACRTEDLPTGSTTTTANSAPAQASTGNQTKRVVVLGGSGRVGRSTAIALAKAAEKPAASGAENAEEQPLSLDLVISGRDR